MPNEMPETEEFVDIVPLVEAEKLTDAYGSDDPNTVMITLVSGKRTNLDIKDNRDFIGTKEAMITDVQIERLRVNIQDLEKLGYTVDPAKGYVLTMNDKQREDFGKKVDAVPTDARNKNSLRIPAVQTESITTSKAGQVLGVRVETHYKKNHRTESVPEEGVLGLTVFEHGLIKNGKGELLSKPIVTMINYKSGSPADLMNGQAPGRIVLSQDGTPLRGKFVKTERIDNTLKGSELDKNLVALAGNNFKFDTASDFSRKQLFDIDGNPNAAGISYENGQPLNSGIDALLKTNQQFDTNKKFQNLEVTASELMTEAYEPNKDEFDARAQMTVIAVKCPVYTDGRSLSNVPRELLENDRNKVEKNSLLYFRIDLAALDAANITIDPKQGNTISLTEKMQLIEFQTQLKAVPVDVKNAAGQHVPAETNEYKITDRDGEIKYMEKNLTYRKDGQVHSATLENGKVIPGRAFARLDERSRLTIELNNKIHGNYASITNPNDPSDTIPSHMVFKDNELVLIKSVGGTANTISTTDATPEHKQIVANRVAIPQELMLNAAKPNSPTITPPSAKM